MTREEALEKFKAEEADKILKTINRKYFHTIVEKRDACAEILKKALWDILEKGKDYPEFKVQEVQFSVLRTGIVDGTYEWMAELHDKDGDYTREDISMPVDMKDIFGVYDECREELYQAAAKYVNILGPADCDLIMMDNFMNQVMYLYMLGVYAFRDLEQDERFNELEIEKVFRVIVGERKDKAFVVYAKLQNPEEEESVLARITMEPTEEDFTGNEFVLYDFSGFHMQDCNISLRNFPFSSFRGCTMQDAEFVACKCMLTDWRGCHIKDVTMDGNVMNCSDFSDSTFENVSFIGVRMDVLPYSDEVPINPAMIPVSFRNAKLKNVDFTGAFLAECDFTGAEIGRINFLGADLRGARMEKKYRDVLELTTAQRNSIRWV